MIKKIIRQAWCAMSSTSQKETVFTATITNISGQIITATLHGVTTTVNLVCDFSTQYKKGQNIKVLVEGNIAYLMDFPEFKKPVSQSIADLYGYGQNNYKILSELSVEDFKTPIVIAESIRDCCLTPHSILIINKRGDLYVRGINKHYHLDPEGEIDALLFNKKILQNCTKVYSNGVRTFVITTGGTLYGWGLNDPYYTEFPKIPCIVAQPVLYLYNEQYKYIKTPQIAAVGVASGAIYEDLFVYGSYSIDGDDEGFVLIHTIGYNKFLARRNNGRFDYHDIDFKQESAISGNVYSAVQYPKPEQLHTFAIGTAGPFDPDYTIIGENFSGTHSIPYTIEKTTIKYIHPNLLDLSSLMCTVEGDVTIVNPGKFACSSSSGKESKITMRSAFIPEILAATNYKFTFTMGTVTNSISARPSLDNLPPVATINGMSTSNYISLPMSGGTSGVQFKTPANVDNLIIATTLATGQSFIISNLGLANIDVSNEICGSTISTLYYRHDYIENNDVKSLKLLCALSLDSSSNIDNTTYSNSIAFTMPGGYNYDDASFNTYFPPDSNAFITMSLGTPPATTMIIDSYNSVIGGDYLLSSDEILSGRWHSSGSAEINFGKAMFTGANNGSISIAAYDGKPIAGEYCTVAMCFSQITGAHNIKVSGIFSTPTMSIDATCEGTHFFTKKISAPDENFVFSTTTNSTTNYFNLENISMRSYHPAAVRTAGMLGQITCTSGATVQDSILRFISSGTGVRSNISIAAYGYQVLPGLVYELAYDVLYYDAGASLNLVGAATISLSIATGQNYTYIQGTQLLPALRFQANVAKNAEVAISNLSLHQLNVFMPNEDGFTNIQCSYDDIIKLTLQSYKDSPNLFDSAYIDNIYYKTYKSPLNCKLYNYSNFYPYSSIFDPFFEGIIYNENWGVN